MTAVKFTENMAFVLGSETTSDSAVTYFFLFPGIGVVPAFWDIESINIVYFMPETAFSQGLTVPRTNFP